MIFSISLYLSHPFSNSLSKVTSTNLTRNFSLHRSQTLVCEFTFEGYQLWSVNSHLSVYLRELTVLCGGRDFSRVLFIGTIYSGWPAPSEFQ